VEACQSLSAVKQAQKSQSDIQQEFLTVLKSMRTSGIEKVNSCSHTLALLAGKFKDLSNANEA